MSDSYSMRLAWRGLIGEGFFTSMVTIFPAFFLSTFFENWQRDVLTKEANNENIDRIKSALDVDLPGLVWVAFGGLFLVWLAIAAARVVNGRVTVDDTGVTLRRGSFRPHEIHIDFDEIEGLFIRKIGIDGLLGIGGLGILFKDAAGDLLIITGLPDPERMAEEIEKRRMTNARANRSTEQAAL